MSRTGDWRKQKRGKSVIRTKVASKDGLGEKLSPKKISMINAQKESMNIPSLASLFSEDEDLSVSAGDDAFCQGLTGYLDDFDENEEFDQLSETDESVGRNIGRKCIKTTGKFLDEVRFEFSLHCLTNT